MVDSELTEIWWLPEQTRDAEMEGSRITKSLEKYHVPKTQRVRESSQGPVSPKLQLSAETL